MADGPWQDKIYRKTARAQRKAANTSDEARALAKEICESIFTRPGSTGKGGLRTARKPEWSCPHCAKPNFMDRINCRFCGVGKPARATNVHAISPVGGTGGANGGLAPRLPRAQLPARPPTKIQRLEQAVAAARDGGAGEAALASLENELQAARTAAADSRPIGARLDSARAKESRAARALEAAEAAVTTAVQRRDAARKTLEDAEKELASLPKAPRPPPDYASEDAVVGKARALLESLECSRISDSLTGDVPEMVLDDMRSLREALDAAAPLTEVAMELGEEPGASDAVAAEVEEAHVATQLGTEEPTEEEVNDLFKKLNGIHEGKNTDEVAKGIIRESLSKARSSETRHCPY